MNAEWDRGHRWEDEVVAWIKMSNLRVKSEIMYFFDRLKLFNQTELRSFHSPWVWSRHIELNVLYILPGGEAMSVHSHRSPSTPDAGGRRWPLVSAEAELGAAHPMDGKEVRQIGASGPVETATKFTNFTHRRER
jgi:hypothetical protein